MNDNEAFKSVAVRPSRIIVIIYTFVKQLFYMFFVMGDYWIARGVAGVIMVTLVFPLSGSKKLTNRQLSVLVPCSVALVEIVLCAIVGGDRLTYILLIGCSLFSLMYADTAGLLITIALSCGAAAFFVFGLGMTLIGESFTKSDELFYFAGLVVVDILIFLIGKYSVGALARFRKMGRTFDTMMGMTPNYVAVINDEAKVEYISRSLAELLEIENREAVAGMPFIDLFPNGEMRSLFGALILRGGSVEDTFEAEIGGSRHWFMLRSVEMDDSSAARFFEWVDITPIIEAQRAAEAAARAKSGFLAKMSHEIRTPMNAIIGITELILRDDIPPRVHEHAVSIKSAGDNLLSIVNDVLDFSKIESGMLEIVPAEYYFASLVNDVINIIRIKTAEKSISFIVNLDSAIPARLIGDEIRLRQILINLLGNAVKYTAEGFISMTIEAVKRDSDTAMLCIEISDSGIGIRPEDADRLFENFVQVDHAANKGVQGTGLGLTITKSLCVAMGGDVSVCSEYGVGSTFTALIPQGIGGPERFASLNNPGDKRVLLYEPREIYAASILCSVENLGAVCTRALDDETFKSALQQDDYRFVFVSSFLLERARKIIDGLGLCPSVVLLTEYGETVFDKNVKTIAMPAHSISIANILNDVTDNAGYGGAIDIGVTFSAPGARVLIVDDISTNLKVAEGLMAPYNMLLDTCSSGEQAVEMIQQTEYDLVFMDHMMPGMDGIEATRLIRALDGEYYRTVPIVALTANAISGVKEIFLQNGMDDFLAKPIETAKLNAILEQWIPTEKKEGYSGHRQSAAAVELKIEGLDTKAGVAATGGDPRHYINTLVLFSSDAHKKLSQIKSASADEDTKLYVTYVHALKSALYSIGARELSRLAAALEEAGRAADKEALDSGTDAFLQKLEALLGHIDEEVSKAKEQGGGEGEIGTELLISLKAALEEYDAAAAGDIISALLSQNVGGERGGVIESVYQNYLMFEYGQAIADIDDLLERLKPGD